MPNPSELAANLAAWRLRDEREHPQGLLRTCHKAEWLNDSDCEEHSPRSDPSLWDATCVS